MLQASPAVAESDSFWDVLEPLLELGIRVVPIKPNARKPYWAHWEFKPRKNGRYGSSATIDRERLRSVTEAEIRPAIAAPSGQPFGGGFTVVLDVDAENGGLDSWVDLCGRLGEPPPTATVLTKTEGCFHKWLVSSSQWFDAPKEIAPGLEVKRGLQLTMVPPTRDYVWAETPWQSGIGQWPELDAYVGLLVTPAPKVQEPGIRPMVPVSTEWSSVDDYLRVIASAKPGARTDALLRYGGKVAFATAIGHGLSDPKQVSDALWAACWTNGLAEDYSADELGRKIQVYERWSDPTLNPLLRDGRLLPNLSLPVCAPRSLWSEQGRGTESDWLVFTDLARFARWEFKPYPIRWAVKSTGLGYEAVRGALSRLQRHGLIERGPSQANTDRRATHTYRLTSKGRTLLSGASR